MPASRFLEKDWHKILYFHRYCIILNDLEENLCLLRFGGSFCQTYSILHCI